MNYEEAETLKKLLKSNKYIAQSGNELLIFIAPETEEYLNQYKFAVKGFWDHGGLLDKYARIYCRDEKYILFGIRKIQAGKFSGGKLDLNEHPELL